MVLYPCIVRRSSTDYFEGGVGPLSDFVVRSSPPLHYPSKANLRCGNRAAFDVPYMCAILLLQTVFRFFRKSPSLCSRVVSDLCCGPTVLCLCYDDKRCLMCMTADQVFVF